MKTCVSRYSFQPLLKSGELNQLELISKVKDMGFDAIEFIDLSPHNGMEVKDYAKLLCYQAQLMAELPLDDPYAYTELVCKLMQ